MNEAVAAIDRLSSLDQCACCHAFEERFGADLHGTGISQYLLRDLFRFVKDSRGGDMFQASPNTQDSMSDVIELGNEYYIRARSSLVDNQTRVLMQGVA